MKIYKLSLLLALVCFHFNPLFGRTDSSSLIKPFGIGLHLEQFKWNEINDLDISPANKIIFTISPIRSFRLEPEFGFMFGKNKVNDLKSSGIYLGMGTFGMFQRKKLNIYTGFRFEYAIIKWDIMWLMGFHPGSNIITNTTKRLSIAPTIGCEYYIAANIAFGGEFGLKYSSLKTTRELHPSEESSYFATDTGLFIRFYF